MVSRNGLVDDEELAYWTRAAQRLADPNRTGREGFDGHGSVWAASEGALRLDTHVTAPAGIRALAVGVLDDYAPFPADAWIDVILSHNVPSRIAASDTLTLRGQLIATNHAEFDKILAEVFFDGPYDERITIGPATIQADGSFTLKSSPSALRTGVFQLGLWLQHRSDRTLDR